MATMTASTLSRTCRPRLWLGIGQALYAGPALGLDQHSGAVGALVVGVGADLVLTHDGRTRTSRTFYLPPRLRHRVEARSAMVAWFVDPATRSHDRLLGQLRGRDTVGIGIDHDRAHLLRHLPLTTEDAASWVADAVGPPRPPSRADPRMDVTAAALATEVRLDAGQPWPARLLAAEVGLSESRFLRVFSAHFGTTLRRYRLWLRLHRAVELTARGLSLTDAAVTAGFANPSHLSSTFHRTFGLQPSVVRRMQVEPIGAAGDPAATVRSHRR